MWKSDYNPGVRSHLSFESGPFVGLQCVLQAVWHMSSQVISLSASSLTAHRDSNWALPVSGFYVGSWGPNSGTTSQPPTLVFFFLMYMCGCGCVYMSVDVLRGHKRKSDTLELELQVFVSHRAGAED